MVDDHWIEPSARLAAQGWLTGQTTGIPHRTTAPTGSAAGRPGADLWDAFDCHTALLDTDGTILAVNAAWEAFAAANGGVDVGVGANYLAACPDDHPVGATVAAGIARVADGLQDRFELQYDCHGPEELRWFRVIVVRNPRRADQVVVRHEPITEQQLATEQAQVGTQLLDAVDAAVVATDLAGVVRTWNHASERLFGWSDKEAVGRNVQELLVPHSDGQLAPAAMRQVLETGRWEGDAELVRKDGTRLIAYTRGMLVRNSQEEPIGVAAVLLDVSARRAMEDQLERSNEWLRAITDRMGDGLCTLDTNGRITYLNPQARTLMQATSDPTGGSFVNRLVGTRSDGTPRQVSELAIGAEFDGTLPLEPTEDLLLRPDGTTLPIEFVATPLPDRPPHHAAGWVVVFRDITERLERQRDLTKQAEHARWMGRIQDALDQDDFALYAQPIVDLVSGEVVQQELLLRLIDPVEGVIVPGAFLPTAEEFGLAPAIDRWVLTRAVAIAAESGRPLEVNLSAGSLNDPALPLLIDQLIDDAGIDPGLLVFEITETTLIDNDEAARRFATFVRELGCQVALDDFGTGYSGFSYLKHFPVDILKIDREFVTDLVDDPASRRIVQAVVSLAAAFGLTTVAEGVEDEDTLRLLRDLGVHQAQGYVLGRPAPYEPTTMTRGGRGAL